MQDVYQLFKNFAWNIRNSFPLYGNSPQTYRHQLLLFWPNSPFLVVKRKDQFDSLFIFLTYFRQREYDQIRFTVTCPVSFPHLSSHTFGAWRSGLSCLPPILLLQSLSYRKILTFEITVMQSASRRKLQHAIVRFGHTTGVVCPLIALMTISAMSLLVSEFKNSTSLKPR